jgi:tRNA threonylcarbamoyladenosine biosynthesis protein TsaB
VQNQAGVRAEFRLTGQRHHVEALTPALEHLLVQVGLSVREVEAVVVDVGPGLFTGLRVGVAAAKGLAQAIGVGVVGFSSLDVLFQAAREQGHTGRVLAAVDARRGEVFAAIRDLDGQHDVVAPTLFSPDQLVAALNNLGGTAVLAVGDGSQRYADAINTVSGVTCLTTALSFPPAATMLTMAETHLLAGGASVAPALVVPIYMREADAVSNFAKISRVTPPTS